MARQKCKGGAVAQFWSAPGPQGYNCRAHGKTSRKLVDHEGIILAMKPHREQPEGDEKSAAKS